MEKSYSSDEASDEEDLKEEAEAEILTNLRDQEDCFEKANNNTWTELNSVDKHIEEKESYLNSMTNNQIQLEYQLIEEMKQEYHHKVMSLEKEKQGLMAQKETISGGEKPKFNSKI